MIILMIDFEEKMKKNCVMTSSHDFWQEVVTWYITWDDLAPRLIRPRSLTPGFKKAFDFKDVEN